MYLLRIILFSLLTFGAFVAKADSTPRLGVPTSGGEKMELPFLVGGLDMLCPNPTSGPKGLEGFRQFTSNCTVTNRVLQSSADICECLNKNTALTRTVLDNEEQNSDFENDEYYRKIGRSILGSINGTIEGVSLFSSLPINDRELTNINSCRVRGIIDAMKNAFNSCEDKELAQRNISKLFGDGINHGDFSFQLNTSLSDIENNLLENARVWSSENPLVREGVNTCLPLKKFYLLSSLEFRIKNIPADFSELEELKKLTSLNTQLARSDKFFDYATEAASHPFINILLFDPALKNKIENSNNAKTIGDLFKDSSFLEQFKSSYGTYLNSKCEGLSDTESYKDLFCKNSITPSPELILEQKGADLMLFSEDINTDKIAINNITTNLVKSCQLQNNNNPLFNEIELANRNYSVKENFTLNSLKSNFIGSDRDEGNVTTTDFVQEYDQFNKNACPIENPIEFIQTSVDEFINSLPEDLKSIALSIERPENVFQDQTSLKNYRNSIKQALREHIQNQITSENPNLSRSELRRMSRQRMSEMNISNSEINDHFKLGSIEAIETIQSYETALATNDSAPVMDYFYNASREDEVQLVSRDTESISSSTGISQRYIPRGLPEAAVGESIYSLSETRVRSVTPDEIVIESAIEEPVISPELTETESPTEVRETVRAPASEEAVEENESFQLANSGITLTQGNHFAINEQTQGVGSEFEREQASASVDNNENSRFNSTSINQIDSSNGIANRNSALDELRKIRDRLKNSNKDLKNSLNRFRNRNAQSNFSPSGNNNFQSNSPMGRTPNERNPFSRNPFNQFSSDQVSANTQNRPMTQKQRESEAANAGKFTDQPSSFGTGGSGGKSKGIASSSGGPSGAGVVSGPGGGIYVPQNPNGPNDNQNRDPLDAIVSGLFKEDAPHILKKVIPHALIMNSNGGVLELIDILGLEGRRFTTLDVYYVTKDSPSYVVRIYDYNIGDEVINDVEFRKRLVNTINVLKKDDNETDQYMDNFYAEGKYNSAEEVLSGITQKLQLMYERPACSNPDYDKSTPCVHDKEIDQLKSDLLTQDEMIKLIDFESEMYLGF